MLAPATADRRFAAVVRVRGSEDAELYRCIQGITVTEDLDRGSSFQVRLTVLRDEEGAYRALEDDGLLPWNRVTLIAAFPDHEDVIMDGYISHVDPASTDEGGVRVDLRGVDASYVMNLEERTRVWTGKTYEQIADEVLRSYNFTPVLPPAAAAEDEPPAVTQRATDLVFLRELARRKGYELFVQGGHAYFRPPDLSGEPQKLIAVNFGCESNATAVQVRLDGTRPTRVVMTRLDPLSGQPVRVEETSSGLEALGRRGLAELRGFGAPQATVVVRRQGAATEAQMREFAQGLLRRHGWWVHASGRLNGLRYGTVLRARKLVTIKGLGRTHNGRYYVRRVIHRLAPRTYSMEFEAVRNAIEQLGDEDFTGETAGALPVPAAAGAGAEADVTRVVASGNEVRSEE